MDHTQLIRDATDTFRPDAELPPPLSLRGANAVDSYDSPEPFDEQQDAPTDAYLEGFTFWAMPYLDAHSWRHYIPRLIEYALGHPADPAMVTEAFVRSLRPPDRVPARLTTLSAEQERVIVAFLETLALESSAESERSDAAEALQEWWHPGAHLRPAESTPPAALSAQPRRVVGSGVYRLTLPELFTGGGVQPVPAEEREIEHWSAIIDRHAVAQIFVNVEPLRRRSFADAESGLARWMRAETAQWVEVPGARKARRLDAPSHRYSPAEPERTTVVIAETRDRLLSLTVRATDRADVLAEMDRVVRSFEIVESDED
jgi:hypothetical protein